MANALHDIRLLKLFACVVRHQGFAAAQQELNLSTSAISTYMSQLEGQLGVDLVERGPRSVLFTHAGEQVVARARVILSEAEDIRSHIIPFARLLELVETGEVDNAPLLILALWLAPRRTTLSARPGAIPGA